MRRTVFANGEYYHVFNRGVDKRNIFLDDRDRFRFVHSMFEFNDRNTVPNVFYYFHNKPIATERKHREMLVEITAFCLMSNHYHFLLRQIRNNGISLFLQKLGTGYVRYFNTRHQRSGTLFEGRFRAIHIDSDTYLTHLSRYIHLNPLELKFPSWKEAGIENIRHVEDFLEKYRWSSYQDYLGKKNFSSLTDRIFLLDYFGNAEEYKKFVLSWTNRDTQLISNLTYK